MADGRVLLSLSLWRFKFSGRELPSWVRATRNSRRAFYPEASTRQVSPPAWKLLDSICCTLDEYHRKYFSSTSPSAAKARRGTHTCIFWGCNKKPEPSTGVDREVGRWRRGWKLDFDLIQETITIHTLKKRPNEQSWLQPKAVVAQALLRMLTCALSEEA